jgi:hypothetical protein
LARIFLSLSSSIPALAGPMVSSPVGTRVAMAGGCLSPAEC